MSKQQLAADAALAVVTLYAEENLFRLLPTFVLTHPLDVSIGKVNVVGLLADASRPAMRNAFSFERLRRVYAKALTGAGIADLPAPPPPEP